MITSEYTTLVRDNEEIRILPNVQFDEIPAGYIVTAYAVIKDNDKKEVLAVLAPGTATTLIKETAKQDFTKLNKQELKEVLRNEGISFQEKASKKDLLELLGD